MIELHNLTHTYGGKIGLGPIDLLIEDNSAVGLVGPNGSGKTSLLRSLCGIGSTSGIRLMEGKPLAKGISRQLTFTASDPVLINEMNVREFLLFDAAVRGIKLDFREVQTVMNRFGCIGFSEQKLKTCSLGMRKRVALAAAWSGSPHLVLLDESTNGLDTEAIFLLKDAISKTLSEGGTVILSAHILSFLQDVCTRVIMLDGGLIVDDFDVCDCNVEHIFQERFLLKNRKEEG